MRIILICLSMAAVATSGCRLFERDHPSSSRYDNTSFDRR